MRPVRHVLFVLSVLSLAAEASGQHPGLPSFLTDIGIDSVSASPLTRDSVLTRDMAIGLALRSSPRLKSLEHEIRSLGHGARQAKASPNPSLSVEVEDFGRQTAGGPSQTTIGIEQTLLLWGKRGRAFDAVDARRLVVEAQWQAEALALYTRIASLYATLLGGEEKLIQAAKRLALARETEIAVAIKLREGAVPESEVQRSAASRSLAQIDSLSAVSDIESSLTELGALVGIALHGVHGRGGLIGASTLVLPDNLETVLQKHPLVVAQLAEREASRREALLARAIGKPDVTLSAGYRRLHDASDNGVLFGISMPLPIRNPNSAGIAESDARIDAADARVREVALELEAEARTLAVAWEQRTAEITMIETQTLPAVELSMTSLDLAYRVGQQPYMNLLDVQRTQSELQTRLIDAKVERAQLEARLESLLGYRIDTRER